MGKIKEDLTGRIFGNLTVLKRDMSKIGLTQGSFWICKCMCNKEIIVSRQPLLNKKGINCGCIIKKPILRGQTVTANSYKKITINKYKKKCEIEKIPFLITDDEFFELVSNNCSYCGRKPENRNVYKRKPHAKLEEYKAIGIDRVIPHLGYIKGNCVPCCKICNFMKTDMSVDDFLKHIHKINNNIKNKNNKGE